MVVVDPAEDGYDENYSPQSPEPSEPSPILIPKNLGTIEGWETPHTTTDDKIFYSIDEPMRICFLPSSPLPTAATPKVEKKIDL